MWLLVLGVKFKQTNKKKENKPKTTRGLDLVAKPPCVFTLPCARGFISSPVYDIADIRIRCGIILFVSEKPEMTGEASCAFSSQQLSENQMYLSGYHLKGPSFVLLDTDPGGWNFCKNPFTRRNWTSCAAGGFPEQWTLL